MGRISGAQKARIKKFSGRMRTSDIARKLGLPVPTVFSFQRTLGLPTKLVMRETEVVALTGKGWGTARISKHFSCSVFTIDRILRKHRRQSAAKQRAANERAFKAAVRLREGSVRALAVKFGVGIVRAYTLAHEMLGGEFRRGRVSATSLPISRAVPKTLPLAAADPYVGKLVEFFNRFYDGKLPPPERDGELIAAFLQYVPPHTPACARDNVAFNLARGLDVLRRQATNTWVH